jgi:hypothetical protein
VGMCWLFVGFGALIAAASAAYLTGQPLDPGAALRQALARAGRLIAANLLAYLVMFGGAVAVIVAMGVITPLVLRGPAGRSTGLAMALLLLVLVFFAALAWAVVTLPRFANVSTVVMIENAGPLAAVRRSRELARGSARRILGLIVLVFVIFLVVQLTLFAVGRALLRNETLASTLGSFFLIPIYPAVGALLTLLYYDLRIRREGLDIELMARDLGELPGGAPAGAVAPPL